MDARELVVERKATIIPFPKEIKPDFMEMVQAKAEEMVEIEAKVIETTELIARENRARRYSRKCQIHDDLMCILSGLSLCGFIVAAYFLLILM